jgi:hypothetical protein
MVIRRWSSFGNKSVNVGYLPGTLSGIEESYINDENIGENLIKVSHLYRELTSLSDT